MTPSVLESQLLRWVSCVRGAHPPAARATRREVYGGVLHSISVGSRSRGLFERATGGDETRAVLNDSAWAVTVAPAGYAEVPGALAEIGVRFDGSPESEQALCVARAIAAAHGANVSAFDAVAAHPGLRSGRATSFAEAIEAIVGGAQRRIEQRGDLEAHVGLGPPVAELAPFSASVDLLVTGSHGRRAVGRRVHGSTSHELARTRAAHCWCSRPSRPPAGRRRPFSSRTRRHEHAPAQDHHDQR